MKRFAEETKIMQEELTLKDFIVCYNKGIPQTYPQATPAMLSKFRAAHPQLFKDCELWTLEIHRKKLMDWLPRNVEAKKE